MDKQATEGSKLAKILGGKVRPVKMPSAPAGAPTAPMPTTSGDENAPGFLRGLKPMKRGGKVKKMNTGGLPAPISPVAQQIIEGKRPPQATPGKMTPDEIRASIGKAFGAK